MRVTATEFRANLFQLVERALQGELIELSHKGRTVRLVPEQPSSKISRLAKKPILKGTPKQVDQAQKRLSRDIQQEWVRKWTNF